MKKPILIIFHLLPIIYLAAQQSKWEPVILDEALIVTLPAGFTQTDTIIKDKGAITRSRIIQANTESCILYLSIDSVNIPLNVHDRKSAYISLEGIGEGVCIQYSNAGYRCERGDTIIDKIPGKKFLFYENQKKLVLFGYVFRANNKTYRIFSTINNDPKDGLRPSDLNKFLASIKFNSGNIKEYKFYIEPESSANKTGFKLNRIIIPGIIVFIDNNIHCQKA